MRIPGTIAIAIAIAIATLATWSFTLTPAAMAKGPAESKSAAPPQKSQRVLQVGPNRRLKRPSDAARIARQGDRVEIDAGEYRDCAVWRAHNLTLRGVGGYAHVRDVTCEGKAIWVIKGDNTRVVGIEFSGALVRHRNGAGIRQEGRHLRVNNSRFHDNENGILTGVNSGSRIVIRNSFFERNGKCEPDCTHGIYIGRIKQLIVTGSTFRDQRIGHHIKSRALLTQIVGNRIVDEQAGTASYSINIPNGGTVLIRSNFIQQGPRSSNPSFIVSIGEEKAKNPSRGILIERNTFVNSAGLPTVFVRNRTRQPAILRGNKFSGRGSKLKGPGNIR